MSLLTTLISSEERSSNSTDTEVFVGAIGSVTAIFFIAVLMFLICKCKRRKRKTSAVENNDENPVYGMYYFADGEHIDYGCVEVQDDNAYYGT